VHLCLPDVNFVTSYSKYVFWLAEAYPWRNCYMSVWVAFSRKWIRNSKMNHVCGITAVDRVLLQQGEFKGVVHVVVVHVLDKFLLYSSVFLFLFS
jgi:hypothetical protein